MNSTDIRSELEHCRVILGRIAVPPELDGLALDLIEHLIRLHDAGRLTSPFLQLSLKSFQDVPELEPVVAPLARLAADKSFAEGHKDDPGRTGLPWVVSRYTSLGEEDALRS